MKDRDTQDGSQFPLTKNTPKATPQPVPTERRTSRRRARPRTFGYYVKWTFLSLFCLVTAGVGAICGNFYSRSPWMAAIMRQFFTHPVASIPFILRGDPLGSYTVESQFPAQQQHSINVLVLGCDSDYFDDHPEAIKGTPGRSDAIMVAHLDFDKGAISALSIPRDTAVLIPGYKGYHKVNAAHAYGGNDLSAETIREDFGISPDYTVSLDFDSFQKVVDAVGGVDLTVDKKLDYDDNWGHLHVHLKPGFQHLNGYQAMGFVRIRHSDDDLHRAERQHEFVEALRQKVTDRSNFLKLPDVMNAITEGIKSNLTRDQMLTLIHWASQQPKENVQLATLPSTEGRSFVYADPVKGADVINRMFFGGNSAVTLHVISREARLAMSGERRLRHRIRRRSRSGAGLSGSADQPDMIVPVSITDPMDPGIDSSTPGASSQSAGTNTPGAEGDSSSHTDGSSVDHGSSGDTDHAKGRHEKPDSGNSGGGDTGGSGSGSGAGSGKTNGGTTGTDANGTTGMG